MPPSASFTRFLLRVPARAGPAPRGFHSKPPQQALGLAETAVGFAALAVSCLGPAGWILAHLEDYKKRE
ncbi:COX8A oxidase, partial [Rhinopomastus cyanomelas]|nr:COX8A oxidase [Rhinopomastus cyanomelas]